uniref:Uncharacterized protein n=1 Tax=Rhizophora mucronata TaxID=61149 RepID=A0A2P2K1V9_RHIMU
MATKVSEKRKGRQILLLL